ncbi:MAG: hypothetical protein AAGE37_00035 [Pseudomonadota bacterium]
MRGILVSLATISLALASCSESEVKIDLLKSEVLNLEQSYLVLNRGPIPEYWAASMHVSSQDLAELVSPIEGLEFPIKEDSAASFKVTSFDLDPHPGRLKTSLVVESEVANVNLRFEINGQLKYKRTEVKGVNNRPQHVFGLDIISVTPTATTWFGRLFGFDAIDNPRIRAIVNTYLTELDFPIVASEALKLPIQFDSRQTVKTGTNGQFTLAVESPARTINFGLNNHFPVFTERGLWLLGAIEKTDIPAFDEKNLPTSLRDLQSRKSELVASIQRIESEIDLPRGSGIWLNKSIFHALIEGYNEIDTVGRTVSLRVENPAGFLVEHWEEIAGQRAGYSAALTEGGGSLRLGKADFAWNDGAKLKIPLDADAWAKVRLHIDPAIGGGWKDNKGLNGKFDPQTLEATYRVRRVQVNGYSGWVSGLEFKCKFTDVSIESGGALKFGIRTGIPIGNRPSSGSVLVRAYDPIPLKFGIPANDKYVARVLVGDPQTQQNGYWLPFRLKVENSVDVPSGQELGSIDNSLESSWKNQTDPDCADSRPTKFLLNGQDYGPNNEIIKVIQEFISAVDKAGHNAEVALDDIEEVVRQPDRLDEKVEEIGRRVEKEARRQRDKLEKAAKKGLDPRCAAKLWSGC